MRRITVLMLVVTLLMPSASATPGEAASAPPAVPRVVSAGVTCDAIAQDGFRWISSAVMANGLPIVAYTSRRPYRAGGDPDEDGWSHVRVAPYLSETAIAKAVTLDDPSIVGRSGYENISAIDVATNGGGGLILVTFVDPVRHRHVVRRSTDLGRTWSAITAIPPLSGFFVDPWDLRGHFHQLYYDGQSGLFYYSLAFGVRDQLMYVTSADGVTWSPIRFWARFVTSNGSNPFQSRVARVFRTNAGTWLMYGNVMASSNTDISVVRFGKGVCDSTTCWPTHQIHLWRWPGADGSPPSPGPNVLHTPGAAFYLPLSSTPDRIHLVFGATGLTGFRSVPTGHLHHFWSDDDGRTWWNENGPISPDGNSSIVGAADAETPTPEPATGPLADIDGTWVPAFGKAIIWGSEGNTFNNAPGLGMSVFGDGARDQARVQGVGGYATCASKRSFVWVHGIRGDFTDEAAFSALLGPLRARYGPARVRNFDYFQDVGYRIDGRCVDMPAHRVPENSGGLPLTATPSSVDPNVCDSQSDVGLNAVFLDKFVTDRRAEFGGPVTLIANSMGGAIVRAFLAYSVAAGTGTHEFVDHVYFLQGAQQGSHLAYVPSALAGLRESSTALDRVLLDAIAGAARTLTGWDPLRPAAADLKPRSETYTFANPAAAHVPDHIGYFNVASDIRWTLELGVMGTRFHRVVGGSTSSLGDYVILPGTDRPTDLPILGGARFDPGTIGRGSDAHQWILRRDHTIQVASLITLLRPIGPVPGDFTFPGDPFAMPESHLQFGTKMHEITYLADRVTGERGPLNALILAEIERQDRR